MKRYDVNSKKVVTLTDYVSGVTESELLQMGLYPCVWESKPDGRYYNYTEQSVFENGVYTTSYPATLKSLTPRQFRLQLLAQNLLDDVEAMAVADKATSIWFEYSLEIQRDNEVLITAATALGMSDADIDAFFIAASKL